MKIMMLTTPEWVDTIYLDDLKLEVPHHIVWNRAGLVRFVHLDTVAAALETKASWKLIPNPQTTCPIPTVKWSQAWQDIPELPRDEGYKQCYYRPNQGED